MGFLFHTCRKAAGLLSWYATVNYCSTGFLVTFIYKRDEVLCLGKIVLDLVMF